MLLLFLLPFTGMGPLPCLTLATFLTAGLVVWAERRRGRRLREAAAGDDGAEAGGPRPARGPMSAGTAVALTLGAVALLVYVIFVIRAA
ncbi:MAG: hypothetical protein AB7V62_01055 [Thermoleophilia bacterium]